MQGPSRALQQKYANYTEIASSYLSSYWFLLSLRRKRSLRPNKMHTTKVTCFSTTTSWTPRKHQQQNLILFPISPLRNCSTPVQDSHTPGHMMWVVALWVHTTGMWKQMAPRHPDTQEVLFQAFHATDTGQTLDRVVQLRKSHVKTSLTAFGKEILILRAVIRVAQFSTFSTLGDAGNHKELKFLLRHIAKHEPHY